MQKRRKVESKLKKMERKSSEWNVNYVCRSNFRSFFFFIVNYLSVKKYQEDKGGDTKRKRS